MHNVIISIINNAWSTGLLIVAMIMVRMLLKKTPKYISCIMWWIVGIKLIFPVSIKSAFSVLPDSKAIEMINDGGRPVIVRTGIVDIDSNVNRYIGSYVQSKSENMQHHNLFNWLDIVGYIWIAGIVFMLCYMILSYVSIKRKVACSIKVGENVSVCEEITSPFLFGILKPHIYLPSGMQKGDMKYILLHEQTHLARRDYLIKPFGFLILTVYWFNPLCWAAYFILCRDIELACDERVIDERDDEWRADYCQVLLNCSVRKQKPLAVPLAFGEVGVKERVKNIIHYKKSKCAVIVAILVCTAVMAVFGTVPNREHIYKKGPVVDLSRNMGADGAKMHYADRNKIIFSEGSGLFVYDTNYREFFRSVDLQSIETDEIRGDYPWDIKVKCDGSEVYLQHRNSENNPVRYIYNVKKDEFTKEDYNVDEKKLFSGVKPDCVSAVFEKDGIKMECCLCNADKTAGELGFKYSDNYNVYPIFVEERFSDADYAYAGGSSSDIIKAEITYNGIHYVCTDEKILNMISDSISNGTKMGKDTHYSFNDVMFLTYKYRNVSMIAPAFDGSKVCLMGDGYYNLSDCMQMSFNDMIDKGFFKPDKVNDTYSDQTSIYTQDDIDSATQVVKKYFRKNFKGCYMKEIYYAGDEYSKDYEEYAERYNSDEVLVLKSSYYVGKFGSYGSLEQGETYDYWNWILVRNKGEKWKCVDCGY